MIEKSRLCSFNIGIEIESEDVVMFKSTILDLPEPLIAKVKDYANTHHTTMTALIIEQLEAVTSFKSDDPLIMFSRGLITKEEAIRLTEVRDYAGLLISLGDADLPLPSLPQSEIDKQATEFVEILSAS
jgi:hypothetical protein